MDTEILNRLFRHVRGTNPEKIEMLHAAGSNRSYYRLSDNDYSVIGCINEDIDENEAFFHLAEAFGKCILNTPEVYAISDDRKAYLQTDLGDQTLYDLVVSRKEKKLDEKLLNYYKTSINQLARLQVCSVEHIDFSKCHPVSIFKRESMLWDLNYFKYYFLKPNEIQFDEAKLDHDFNALVGVISHDSFPFFMYRDFQSRNIMIYDGQPWFIDFQGGRKGPVSYDLASLLYQAKASLDNEDRKLLLDYYAERICEISKLSKEEVVGRFYTIALLRVLQVLGAYGFRGLIQRKTHFIESLSKGIETLAELRLDLKALDRVPELKKCIDQVINLKSQFDIREGKGFKLVVKSFSYKNGGIPVDLTGHGGGYVFDCRALPNPGREEKYKSVNGLDNSVQEYFKDKKELPDFINMTGNIVESHLKSFLQRGFKYLTVAYGCTGGQHRSVYCADQLARVLHQKHPSLNIEVEHIIPKARYNFSE